MDSSVIYKYFDDFTENQRQAYDQMQSLYTEWNSQINVISRKDMDGFYIHHVLHSLSIAAAIEMKDGSAVLDLGCGGGFPGIPLAIFYPNINFTLLDGTAKKLKVVADVCEKLGLHNVQIKHGRAEELKNIKFDYVVSRGVASLKSLWQISRPLIKKGNKDMDFPNGLICLKGGDIHQEISESLTRPNIVKISSIFQEEPYFQEKYILHITR